MALGAMFALANTQRHWEMYKRHRVGEWRRISGTPFATSIFFFIGWRISPLAFTPWILLVLLTELPAFITIVPSDYESGVPTDSEEQSDTPPVPENEGGVPATSEIDREEPPTTTG